MLQAAKMAIYNGRKWETCMLQLIIVPLYFVIGLWLAVSSLTNSYLVKSEQTHASLLAENVSSITAITQYQRELLELSGIISVAIESGFDLPSSFFLPQIEESCRAYRNLLSTCIQDHEIQLAQLIEKDFLTLRNLIIDASSNAYLGDRLGQSIQFQFKEIGNNLDRLRALNMLAIAEKQEEEQVLKNYLMMVRYCFLGVGPIVGTLLGWHYSKRLRNRVALLASTLSDANPASTIPVTVRSDGSDRGFELLQSLAEQLTARIALIEKNLETAKNEVIRGEKLAAIGELAAGVAHELRNPLTSIRLLLQFTAEQPGVFTGLAENISLMLGEIDRMERTVQGLLDFSRPSSMQITTFDLIAPLERAIRLSEGRSKSAGIHLRFTAPEDSILFQGDEDQIQLVFLNLILNGIEAVISDGEITIAVQMNREKRTVCIEFKDTGPGIPEHLLPTIFEPFISLKRTGTGLGLAFCRRVVLDHCGTITAINLSDQGACFRVELPAYDAVG